MNEDPLSPLRDVLLRRELTADEERRVAEWLTRHPEAAAEWRVDLALARSVRQLRPVPVPSNFTSRVLDEVRRESRSVTDAAPDWRAILRSRFLTALGTAAVVFGVAAIAWQLQRARVRHEAAYAQQVSALRALSDLSPAMLEDFDAIQRFDAGSPSIDFELLAALQ